MALAATSLAFYWSINDWTYHPFVKKLSLYCVNNSWRDVANDINNEFRRYALCCIYLKILSFQNNILEFASLILSNKLTILFLRIDKLCIRTNPVMKVVVTDNWIIMVGQWPWNLHLAHQSDVELKIVKTDQHQLSTDGQAGGSQYLSILVKNRRANLESFTFR